MSDNRDVHYELGLALIANVIDVPALMDDQEISNITPEMLPLSLAGVWSSMRKLHRENNLTAVSLISSMPQVEGIDLRWLNFQRDQYRMPLDELAGIAGKLSNHAFKKQLRVDASWLAKESVNGSEARDLAREMIRRMTPLALDSRKRFTHVKDVLGELYDDIVTRSQNPSMIWGIPYKYYPFLSKVTGGKHSGELTIFAGEPKVGKSWWVDQDAMGAALDGTPTAIWCGEMKKKQIARRMLQLLGLDGRRSKTGYMTKTDWDILNTGIETLEGAPIYLEDSFIHVKDIHSTFVKLIDDYGIEEVVLDYAFLIGADGKDEVERTQNVSREVKRATQETNLACTLITSVNKMGMDVGSTGAVKSNIRGSGQQIHDADNIFILTKFSPVEGDAEDMTIKPKDYDKYATLHIAAGRELDENIPGGCIHFLRDGSPFFKEWKKEKDSAPDQDLIENWQRYVGDD